MPPERGYHRNNYNNSRSPSPDISEKHKRSWQNAADDKREGHPAPRHRSPQPPRPRKDFRSPSKTIDNRRHLGSPVRSSSHHYQKRARPNASPLGHREPPAYGRQPVARPPRGTGRHIVPGNSYRHTEGSEFRVKQRSPSSRLGAGSHDHRMKQETKARRQSPSPDRGPPVKKKSRRPAASASPVQKRLRTRSRSRGRPQVSSSHTKNSAGESSNNVPQRKISSSSSKKKPLRLLLHQRFAVDDQDSFEIEENVTIAIVRKPDAQPSEDVTVKKVFDASLFKMIHKKTEGKKPIFDREEIKLWRHDGNLADDPDFERRLVRVKASGTSRSVSESFSQMSPDIVRKAISLHSSGRSNRSPQSEPQIRLDPRPDPRYEMKFRQQMEKEEEFGKTKRKSTDNRKRAGDRSSESRAGKGDKRERLAEDVKGGDRRDDTYDLRQALERRRSDREDGSFRGEDRRDISTGEEYHNREVHRGPGPQFDPHRPGQEPGGRSVVVDKNRLRRPYRGEDDWNAGRSWGNRNLGNSRGRGGRGRGGVHRWSMERGPEGDVGEFREDDRNFDRRQMYDQSPPNNRGWRGGFRGRVRGRGRDFAPRNLDVSPTDFNDSFKYSQHDDRDVSPGPYRGRFTRGHFVSRGFGDNFRSFNRGVRTRFRARGFRGGFRGRGIGPSGDRQSMEKFRDVSTEREWKHDLYDSLQTEVEQPHSTTSGT